MDGEFLVEERFGVQPAVGGGNLLIAGQDIGITLASAEAAVEAMRQVAGVILPFPDGVVRSGSKVGSRYKTRTMPLRGLTVQRSRASFTCCCAATESSSGSC